ncbi:uncharacterized protein LOC113281937 isoform X2 [Papaver somniferum]|uniref:uncharacterized protein LOC113281937 isoform X2 n=1 Tax=Papaver somniferum TaxID=3469 RepID=UPI000E7024B3|nr:uncharacterized protein LOC113281937 isoform X2 [Papaver somniferum]
MKLRSGKKTCSSPKKKTTITQLEENLLLEIFSLLSFNSIFRFRCVSRGWASLLSDCRFMNKWSQINGSQSFPWLVYHSKMDFGISYSKSSASSELISGNYNDESDIFCLKEYRGLLCFLAISKTSRYLSVWVFEEDWNIVHKDIVLLDFVAGMYRRYNMEEYEAFEEVDSESESNYCDKENGAIEEVEVIGFSPVDANVILFGCNDGVWAYDIESTKSEELIEPSFMATTNLVGTRYRVYNSFAIKTMPTVLPSPSWKSIPVIMDQQGHRQSSAVGMVASASQMSYGAAQSPANK